MMRTRRKWGKFLLPILLILLAMAAALFVRLPSAHVTTGSPETDAAYTGKNGLRYMTDPDSYYHVRLVDNQLSRGHFGTKTLNDGTSWDTRSFWPEGRSADYQPGIVFLTIWVWKAAHALFGTDLYTVEWALAPILSTLAALVAYFLGSRMSGKAGGFVAGILVSCSSAFVVRTTFGRFDTDMFVILMDLLLILFITESLRARTWRTRLLHSLGFAASAFAYSLCWTPESALLFALLALGGGLLYCLALLLASEKAASLPAFLTLLLCATLSLSSLLLRFGFSLFSSLAGVLNQASSSTGTGTLPNVFSSISELQAGDIVPDSFMRWFAGYVPGRQLTLLNGVGGLAVALMSMAALIWLARYGLTLFHRGAGKQAESQSEKPWGAFLSGQCCCLYFCALGFLFAIGLYATGKGLRFMEHFAVPVGLLAGSLIGWFAHSLDRKMVRLRPGKAVICLVLCMAAVIPTVSGSLVCSQADRPSISDASADGMQWIRKNASDPDAVVASWWDLGYFYESESGHPCLWDGYWDGGSAGGIRAILVARALTANSRELSAKILHMLSGSGNRGINMLMEYTDIPTAFEVLWEALPLSGEEAKAVLTRRLAMTESEAATAESLLHPEPRETYLVLTGKMMLQFGWFEYFANWDFTGTLPLPVSTLYNYTPDGYSISDSETGREYQERIRSEETLWHLALEGDGGDVFSLVFGENDGVESVQVWHVKP